MSRSASSAPSASLARRNTFARVSPQIRSPGAMHAIAPVPARNRTHAKPVVFDGGVPALDVAAGARARTRSHRQPAIAGLASPYGRAELFRIGAEVRFQASISASVTGLTERHRSPS
jgi:hypothetical protein